MISEDEILKGQDCPPDLEANLESLLEALNKLRELYGQPMIVTSGYRPPDHNAAVGGRSCSAHLTCEAADFSDPAGSLKNYLLGNVQVLEECGLYMENPAYQPAGDSHVHLQTRPVPSGNRVFIP